MDKLPPIPTPAAQRWRAFRVHGLPMIIFAGVALSVAFLWKGLDAPTATTDGAGTVGANLISMRTGIAQSNRIEVSLPVLVNVPDGVKSAPEESVDLPAKPAKP